MNNTIAAIATATGAGGIGIIRMSGDNCFDVLKKIFVPIDKKFSWNNIKGYTIKYGYIINSESKEKIFQTVRITYSLPDKTKKEVRRIKRYSKDSLDEIEKFLENSQSIQQLYNIDLNRI